MKKTQQTKSIAHYQDNVVADLRTDPKLQIAQAAADGCLLHKLYLDNRICEEHFHAGLAFAKLYGLAMRSLGIHNRVKSACQTWDQLYGINYDPFSNRKIEGLWRYIMKALDPTYHDEMPMREIAFALVLTIDTSKTFHISQIKETLEYLQTIFEKIEESPYKLGLFKKSKAPRLVKMQ